ncbi:VWA domain-containing protein, partial [bacterium]|nr:VWA domain-containing protein [bacterium]
YEADTNLRLSLIVDVSGSMNFGIDGSEEVGKRKIDYARQLAGTLAYLAAFQGDAVGLYAAGTEFTKEIPPKRSGAHLRFVLDELGDMEGEGETGLAEALHQAAEKIAQRALVVIISDLFLDPETLKSCFQHLRYRKHDVAVFHLLEQNEIDFQFDRPVRFVDLEGAAPMLVDPTTIAKQYRAAVQQYLESLNQIMKDSVVDYRRVGIEQDHGEVLANFLLARKK